MKNQSVLSFSGLSFLVCPLGFRRQVGCSWLGSCYGGGGCLAWPIWVFGGWGGENGAGERRGRLALSLRE
ncbi:hypothetical protein OIU84_025764 [Salix udensis]|uniref:Uncharacterized protein n=1 Tax=Salix udensis TaxID=889485 RepID=A0AAD6KLJ9_9ROSI|nr:hypothetical protein OIU84_025764 [Salix udensis]